MDIRTCKKISIIGPCGSGKSVLAVRLGMLLNLPVHHIDCIYHKPNGGKEGRPVLAKILNDITSGDKWIIDGNYKSSFARRFELSDAVIFLNFSEEFCIKSVTERQFKPDRVGLPEYYIETAESLERLVSFHIREKYPEMLREHILPMVEKYRDKVAEFKTREDVEKFLDTFCIGEGAVSKAFLSCDRVLLIGKRQDSYRKYTEIAEHLNFFDGKIKSLCIPRVPSVIAPCGAYPLGAFTFLYVNGTPLDKVIDACTIEQRKSIGKKLAEFVTEMQGLSPRETDSKKKEIEINCRKLQMSIDAVYPYLTDSENEKLKSMAIKYKNFLVKSRFYMTHGDLHFENLIVDDEKNLVGVIDFGNTEYYVPEVEFMWMWEQDRMIYDAMVENYGRKIDDGDVALVRLAGAVRFFRAVLSGKYAGDIEKQIKIIRGLL